uniref:Nose resistant to fluoxetine protein 6 n=1 Tax=Ditylenchus dipsaci TaxID=166011 RepID=A0A915ELE1_9BILA
MSRLFFGLLLNYTISMYNSAETALGKKLVCNVDVQCSNAKPENQLWNDSLSVFVLCFILFILGLLFFGTCYDLYVARPLEAETEHQRNKQKRHELIKQSLKADTDLEEDHSEKASKISSSINLQPQGLFVTLVMMFSVPRNLEYIMSTNTESGQIRCLHGARFLSMSWIIFGHTYYYICTSLTTDNLVQTLHEFPKYFYNQFVVQAPLAWSSNFLHFLGKLKRNQIRLTAITTWIAYFFRRYLRLTPVYVVIMLLSVTLSLMMRAWDGPVLLHKFKLGGVLIGILLLVLSSAYNLYITISAVLGDYWADLYVKPYIRCGPYIIGCLVAYVLLEKKQNPFKLSVTQWILGWALTRFWHLLRLWAVSLTNKTGEISDWWAVLYTLAGRPAFAVCLGWITFACETNHGKTVNSVLGHKMFIPLTAHVFFVAVFMSYAVALVFSLAFEMPVMHVDKLLFGVCAVDKRRQQQPASSDGIIGQPTGQPNKKRLRATKKKRKHNRGCSQLATAATRQTRNY